ncbi:MerR family transcriptional regulator [Arthrobacter sp. ATA002]|uniref:MerR family transcriptional regulator n=1 Tax=Arthrobacter sp. ATA002 TaxID=2991715 RepID=UPI0022A72181|nr:MerR family transcriptional regulator [Arthrobacter sp. ATA002]WAP52210.1 MerR family transcriptional regulator [Arthrobacter sp. ATA002]
MGRRMRIGELSERTGASVRSLRYYEVQGLLRSERTPSGQRTYSDDAVDYVHLIRLFLASGLPTRKILEMMPCMRSGTTTPEQRAMLDGERRRIDEQIAELTTVRTRLLEVIDDAARRDGSRAASSASEAP